MTTAAQVHNAFCLSVEMYGALLKDQQAEIDRLKQQVAFLTEALKRASLPTDGAKADVDLDGLGKGAKLAHRASNADGGEDIRKTSSPAANGQ